MVAHEIGLVIFFGKQVLAYSSEAPSDPSAYNYFHKIILSRVLNGRCNRLSMVI